MDFSSLNYIKTSEQFFRTSSVGKLVEEGWLEGFAKEMLDKFQMREIEIRLDTDLELGEELERIYISLEQTGWEAKLM